MPDFHLSDENIQKLRHKFSLFQRERIIIHDLLKNYAADYRQFEGSYAKRYEYLRKKYISQSPDLTHLIFQDNSILWSVYDIAIVLGRHLTSINRNIKKIEQIEGFCARLLAIRENTKNPKGRTIQVYHEEIFDLLLDLYEDEYLLRFSEPRRGNKEFAPNITEVRRFWQYLKDCETFNDYSFHSRARHLPDIPAMRVKDILALIWDKMFNIRTGTVCSVIFAVCFELSRRLFGVHLWMAVIPALVSVICIILIRKRKFSPDTLSDIGAGALLFVFLWVSAVLSVDKLNNNHNKEAIKPVITLKPFLSGDSVNFRIESNIENVKEYFYCISPDKNFHSAGFLRQINTDGEKIFPSAVIPVPQLEGTTDIFVKFIDRDNNESPQWKFRSDIALERFNLLKQSLLNSETSWLYVGFFPFDDTVKVRVNIDLYSSIARDYISEIIFALNDGSFDGRIDINQKYEDSKRVLDYMTILSTHDNSIYSVSSYIIFKDGSSSDIRVSRL